MSFSKRHLRLLAPGPWLALALVGWWGLRFVGLVAMRAFVELEPRPVLLAQGLFSDLLLLYVLFSLPTLARVLGSRGQRLAANSLGVGFGVLAAAVAVLRVVDTVGCWFGLAHLTETMWLHIAPGSLGYVLTPEFVGAFVSLMALGGVLIWLGVREARWRLPEGKLESPARAASGRPVSALLVVSILSLLPLILAPVFQNQHPYHWALVPEVNGLRTLWGAIWGEHGGEDSASVEIPILSPSVIQDLRRVGLLASDQDPDAPYPLMRKGFGRLDPLPLDPAAAARGLEPLVQWTRARGAPGKTAGGRPPNVLLVLVESMSLAFTPLDPRGNHPEAMPALGRLAADLTSVDGFVNVTSPTANGLIASLCATLPPSAVQEIEVGGSVDGNAAYRCIADILGDFGYSSHFYRGASKVYMACEATLRAHGFDEVQGREDLKKLYPDRPTNSWGYYDDTLVDHLIDRMDHLEVTGKPWLISTLTLGSHLPGFPYPGCPLPPSLADGGLLGGFYCTDWQLDRLFSHMKRTGVWDHTLVLITGDHAQLPTRKVEALIADKELFGSFAPLPLLIHDPLHQLPRRVSVHSGQLDLVPTLLHLLGAPEVENSMMGYSIFGERSEHPLIAGRIGKRLAYVATNKAHRELPMGILSELCAGGQPLFAGAPIGACALQDWFSWLDALWRGHRLYPADRYRQGESPAAKLLRLKWLRYDAKEERQRRDEGKREREHRPPVGG